jgi:PAS domain S-box-containing protein
VNENSANDSKTQEALYSEILRNLSLGILILERGDHDNLRTAKILEANTTAAHFLGVTPDALIGVTLDHLSQSRETRFIRQCQLALKSGIPRDVEEAVHSFPGIPSGACRIRAFPLSANRIGLTLEDRTFQKVAERRIRQNEQRFRLLVRGVKDYAIFMLDPNGEVLSWNEGAERLKGYTSEEIIGKNYSTFFTAGDKRNGKPEAQLREAAEEGQAEHEGWRVRKDGSTFWANAVITALRDEEGSLYGFAKITRDMTERKEREESVRSAKEQLEVRVQERTAELVQVNEKLHSEVSERKRTEDQLRALAARLQTAREDERTHVAREIHDEFGQMCTALKMDISWIAQRLPKDQGRLKDKTDSALKLVGELIQSLRRLSTELRPNTLDALGLVAAIEWQAQEFQAHTGVQCELLLPEKELNLNKERSTALFRIFQETLTNVARHADATVVQTNLVVGETEVVLHIHDNGKGFDLSAADRSASLGLLGMRERAQLLGGDFKIDTSPGSGTTVIVRIPLQPLS